MKCRFQNNLFFWLALRFVEPAAGLARGRYPSRRDSRCDHPIRSCCACCNRRRTSQFRQHIADRMRSDYECARAATCALAGAHHRLWTWSGRCAPQIRYSNKAMIRLPQRKSEIVHGEHIFSNSDFSEFRILPSAACYPAHARAHWSSHRSRDRLWIH